MSDLPPMDAKASADELLLNALAALADPELPVSGEGE